MRHQKESLEKLCRWKEIDELAEERGERDKESYCARCDGYNSNCLAYMPREKHKN